MMKQIKCVGASSLNSPLELSALIGERLLYARLGSIASIIIIIINYRIVWETSAEL